MRIMPQFESLPSELLFLLPWLRPNNTPQSFDPTDFTNSYYPDSSYMDPSADIDNYGMTSDPLMSSLSMMDYGSGGNSYGFMGAVWQFLNHVFGNRNKPSDGRLNGNNSSYSGNGRPAKFGSDGPSTSKSVDEDFRQGQHGNCAIVAAIKAGLDKFGVNGLFHPQKTADGGYIVKLRNGNVFKVTKDDLDQAKRKSDFQPTESSKSVPDEVYLAYAVAAKSHQKQHGGSVSGAMDAINNGLPPTDAIEYLGVHAKEVSVTEAENDPNGAVVVDSDHAMEARRGTIDLWGEVVADENAPGRLGQRLEHGFVLV